MDYAMKTFTKQEIIDAVTDKFESVESYAEKKGVTRQAIYAKIDRADNKTSNESRFLRQLIKEKALTDNSVRQKNSGDGTNYNLNNSTLTNTDEEIKSLRKDIERLETLIKSKDETIAALKIALNK
jgi:predicted DNA-binding protein YlxM (UPF0122 family)